MRRTVALAAATIAVAATALFAVNASAESQPPQGQFATPCGYSHRAPDDPIVFPAQPRASHSHDFVGNVSTDAFSTYDSLRAAPTMCHRAGDTAAYWAPTLQKGSFSVAPLRAQIYYLPAGKRAESIRPFPRGLRMIAGDARATAAQDRRITVWHCGPESSVPPSSSVPTCGEGQNLRVRVTFPDCWNGRDLDSANHKSHMAYSMRGACSSAYPVSVPRIQLNLIYPIRGGSDVALASGGQFSAHADFVNSWDQAVLASLVARCLNARVVCHAN